MEVKEIEKVEAKPEVNIFLRKPFIAKDKENQQPNDDGFQGVLDESMDRLKQNSGSFNDTVNKIIDDTYSESEEQLLSPRQLQLLELQRARRQFESVQKFKQDDEAKVQRLKH
jgi:hypothetical protein